MEGGGKEIKEGAVPSISVEKPVSIPRGSSRTSKGRRAKKTRAKGEAPRKKERLFFQRGKGGENRPVYKRGVTLEQHPAREVLGQVPGKGGAGRGHPREG